MKVSRIFLPALKECNTSHIFITGVILQLLLSMTLCPFFGSGLSSYCSIYPKFLLDWMLGLSLIFVTNWWLTGVKVRSLQPQTVKWMGICQGSTRCKALIREARETLSCLGRPYGCMGMSWTASQGWDRLTPPIQDSNDRELLLCRVTLANVAP